MSEFEHFLEHRVVLSVEPKVLIRFGAGIMENDPDVMPMHVDAIGAFLRTDHHDGLRLPPMQNYNHGRNPSVASHWLERPKGLTAVCSLSQPGLDGFEHTFEYTRKGKRIPRKSSLLFSGQALLSSVDITLEGDFGVPEADEEFVEAVKRGEKVEQSIELRLTQAPRTSTEAPSRFVTQQLVVATYQVDEPSLSALS